MKKTHPRDLVVYKFAYPLFFFFFFVIVSHWRFRFPYSGYLYSSYETTAQQWQQSRQIHLNTFPNQSSHFTASHAILGYDSNKYELTNWTTEFVFILPLLFPCLSDKDVSIHSNVPKYCLFEIHKPKIFRGNLAINQSEADSSLLLCP